MVVAASVAKGRSFVGTQSLRCLVSHTPARLRLPEIRLSRILSEGITGANQMSAASTASAPPRLPFRHGAESSFRRPYKCAVVSAANSAILSASLTVWLRFASAWFSSMTIHGLKRSRVRCAPRNTSKSKLSTSTLGNPAARCDAWLRYYRSFRSHILFAPPVVPRCEGHFRYADQKPSQVRFSKARR